VKQHVPLSFAAGRIAPSLASQLPVVGSNQKQTDSTVADFPIISQLQLQTYGFDLVKIDSFGKIVERKRGEANYYAEALGGGIAMDMVMIPGGAFLMGSPETE